MPEYRTHIVWLPTPPCPRNADRLSQRGQRPVLAGLASF